MPVEHGALDTVVLERVERVGRGAVGRVERHRKIPADGEIEEPVQPRSALLPERVRVGRALERIPRQADLADAHDP